MFAAIRSGDLHALKSQLINPAMLLQRDESMGYTPILLAAILGHKKIVRYLYQINKHSFTALIINNPTYLKGMGDKLFGLKLLAIVNKILKELNYQGEILFISDHVDQCDETISILRSLNVIAISKKDYYRLLRFRQFKVNFYIHGPLLNYFLLTQVTTQVLLLQEYNYYNKAASFWKTKYNKLSERRVDFIKTGFPHVWNGKPNKYDGKGIFLSNELLALSFLNNSQSSEYAEKIAAAWQTLSTKIHSILLNNNSIAEYYASTNLAFCYIQNKKNLILYQENSHEHFLRVLQIYNDATTKHQDVLSVGGDRESKYKALLAILPDLIKREYQQVIYIDLDKGSLENIFNSNRDGKIFRFIHLSHIKHAEMIAMLAISGDLVGVTGDQSFSEALSAQKLIVYECMRWKLDLALGYINLLWEITKDKNVKTLAHLLIECKTDQDFKQLSKLLHDNVTCIKLKAAGRVICENYNVSVAIKNYFHFHFGWSQLNMIDGYAHYLVYSLKRLMKACQKKWMLFNKKVIQLKTYWH